MRASGAGRVVLGREVGDRCVFSFCEASRWVFSRWG